MDLGGDLVALHSFLIKYLRFIAVWVPDCFSAQAQEKDIVVSVSNQLQERGGKKKQLLGNFKVTQCRERGDFNIASQYGLETQ